ncbi:MAG TPA: NUDIX domain-containing protein [Anaerolineales bacterium]|nr:NUDIX domain-containing protein [Anaerolineales bacterium]
MKQIRPIAICVFRKGNRILVSEGYNRVKDEYFYRPLGGGIEFGEHSADTICREVLEEVNLQAKRESLKYLGTLENIFQFNGETGHEIVFVYDGILEEPSVYEQRLVPGREANGEEIRAVWKSLDEFENQGLILYPTGLLELLR